MIRASRRYGQRALRMLSRAPEDVISGQVSYVPSMGKHPLECRGVSSLGMWGGKRRLRSSFHPQRALPAVKMGEGRDFWMKSGFIHFFVFRSCRQYGVRWSCRMTVSSSRQGIPSGPCVFPFLPVVVLCWYPSSSDGLHDHCGCLFVEEPLAHVVHVGSYVGEIFPVSVAEII